MRVLVTTIPFTGMKIDAPISMADLNARLREGRDNNSVVFEDAPVADLTLTRTHGGVLVTGVISGRCKQDCSSCGDLVAHQACATIDWILQGDSDRAAADDDLDDPGVIVYQGEHVDLEEHLQEALILSMSPFWHPPRDEHERCLTCHRDCSKRVWRSEDAAGALSTHSDSEQPSSRLGALLKGALKRSSE
jgi:uncharacterized metal-binding protein YceD (DUF177 family)